MLLWQPGQELDNDTFVVEQLLGYGGFGVTYRVRQSKTNKLFVVKTLKPEFKENPNFEQLQLQFINEVITLASCRHPNIVSVFHKIIQHNDLFCMVMEHIEGPTLGSYLKTKGRFPEERAIALITKIGEALEYVHQQDLLHRDIKPDNIMLRQGNNEPVLIDFGLARELIDDLTYQSMSHSGTPFYAPTEEYDSENNYGAWTDVYALAATLYTLLVGKPQALFAHIRKYEFAFNKRDPLIPPQQHIPELSDHISKAILEGMAIEVKDRPQTVREWLKQLTASNIIFSGSRSVEFKRFEFETVRIKEIKVVKSGFLGFGEKNKEVVLNREKRSAKYFTEDLENGVTLDMVEILGGTFMMGSSKDGLKIKEEENPQHEVKIADFYISKFPITQTLWRHVALLPQVHIELDPDPCEFKGDELPVESINWCEAVEFCKRLSKVTEKKYRLPSEAEWEYACRAGTTTPFYFGKTITTELANYRGTDYEFKGKIYPGNYGDAPKGVYRKRTTIVGTFPPNAFGLYDMYGNVWEWCQDDWNDNYENAPDDGRAWLTNNDNTKAIRGGSWNNLPSFFSSSNRFLNYRMSRNVDIGFRIVL